jgi:MoaA/NifB/PqqE/SkfB family radical SAM enzyme
MRQPSPRPAREPFRRIFNRQIQITYKALLRLLRQHPASVRPLLRVIRRQNAAARARPRNLTAGIPVPPLIIVSTTEACNLRCAGCYAQALIREPAAQLPEARIRSVVAEAADLGVSAMLLAGGEPLLQTAWLDALASHSQMAGLVFTNGTLLRGSWLDWFDRQRQILPIVSVEGGDQLTDQRRGAGVAGLIRQNLQLLKERGIPYGLSITLNRQNLAEAQSAAFIGEAIGRGCRLFLFVEYVPVEEGTEDLALTQPERLDFIRWTETAGRQFAAHFMIFPGDEEPYGGCLASARGFVHITASGDLEPCPFAPYSDSSLQTLSLAEALRSNLLRQVREQHHLLQEGRGGCALWQNRAWLAGLQAKAAQTADPDPS